MNVNVTTGQLKACIDAHYEALVHQIRDCGRSAPPADGAILTIVNTIDVLETIIPSDDPAGRGVGMGMIGEPE
jgi:hypothetical protein